MFPFRVNDRDRHRLRNNHKNSNKTTNKSTKKATGKVNSPSPSSSSEKHHRHRSNPTNPSSSHRSSSHGRSSRNSTRDRDRDASTTTASTTSSSRSSTKLRRSSMPNFDGSTGPSDLGTVHFLESKISLPYPGFSKAHSREVVGRPDIPTPDHTDVENTANGGTGRTTATNDNGRNRNADNRHHKNNNNNNNDDKNGHRSPPSPPLTNDDQQYPPRKDSVHRERDNNITTPTKDEKNVNAEEKEKSNKNAKTKVRIRTKQSRSSSSLRGSKDDGANETNGTNETTGSAKNSSDTPPPRTTKLRGKDDPPSRTSSSKAFATGFLDQLKIPKRPGANYIPKSPEPSHSTVRDAAANSVAGDSDATSIPPDRQQSTVHHKPMTPPLHRPSSRSQSSSRRPTATTPYSTPGTNGANGYGRPTVASNGRSYGTPPPPPEVPGTIPRVDYLLHLGGLNEKVPKSLLAAGGGPYSAGQPQASAMKVFEPFNRLLDDYQKVMNKAGSLAVATGYRSVARRLLDRLEAVFARDISSESCHCLMCGHGGFEEHHQSGVSWGEILELVSGRRELPNWPPFAIAPSVIEPALSTTEEHIPMQKLDIDVPEQYREHYIRQSHKTKVAVDNWLSEQTDQATSSSPPDAVDDETLTFAILTRLEPAQRPIFCALLGIRPTTPVPSSDGPKQHHQQPASLISSSLAIERLYRLPSPPRDPETAIYMLNNPGIHHVLATLAAISDDEWEILISGRFDGFLRSGAEDDLPHPSTIPPRWASRSATPFSAGSIPRKPTPGHMDGTSSRPRSQPSSSSYNPASFGGPIALDEENEIASLAEVERDIFLGMEALEDAFEALHSKAEKVRSALRERGAGLLIANQSRRGASSVGGRMSTPGARGPGSKSNSNGWEDDGMDDDWLDDVQSLCPDDSASNVSSSRRRRPKRRSERRTPAPVEEEDEGEAEGPVYNSGSGRRYGRRRY